MYIYKITNLSNDKIYIGQTQNSIEERMQQHIYKAKNINSPTNYFMLALRKYKYQNFKIEVICKANNKKELNQREKFCIRIFKSHLRDIGYNSTMGGSDMIFTPEIVAKISNTLKGRKLTQEQKEKHTNSIRKRIKENGQHPNLYIGAKKYTDSIKRKVYCFETGLTYNSISECAIAIGLTSQYTSSICKQINRKLRHVAGHTFKYIDTEELPKMEKYIGPNKGNKFDPEWVKKITLGKGGKIIQIFHKNKDTLGEFVEEILGQTECARKYGFSQCMLRYYIVKGNQFSEKNKSEFYFKYKD